MKRIITFFFIIAILYSCSSTVSVNSIIIDEERLDLTKGDIYKFALKVQPSLLQGDVNWISTDNEVASVSDEGVVTAIAPGDTKVVAEVGGVYDYCIVYVKGKTIESMEFEKSYYNLSPGDSQQLELSVLPSDADCSIVEWESTDPEIVTVDRNGLVTAASGGSADIIAKTQDLSIKCRIIVTGLPNLGDFFYSDGSYSEELVPGKDVIGVVFWIGDPSEDDPILKKDHPECKNGLVVAIKKAGVFSWQESYSEFNGTVGGWIMDNLTGFVSVTTDVGMEDPLNKKLGYNNTEAMRLFNKANQVYAVNPVTELDNFSKEFEAPHNTSGWFFPSAKEVSLLCSGELNGNIFELSDFTENRNRINSRLKMLAGADILSGIYWTSSESTDTKSFLFDFVYGVTGGKEKGEKIGSVVYILAF